MTDLDSFLQWKGPALSALDYDNMTMWRTKWVRKMGILSLGCDMGLD